MVCVDLLAVSIVVPLLSNYFLTAGADKMQISYISSLYSAAQILGSIAIGIIGDFYPKHYLLVISYIGSAVSYSLVGYTKTISILFFSRILIGLVKHSQTVTTMLITQWTVETPHLRMQELGKLKTISTACFLVGPSVGGLLYKYNDKYPVIFASLLFALNILLCFLWLDKDNKQQQQEQSIQQIDTQKVTKNNSSSSSFQSEIETISSTTTLSLLLSSSSSSTENSPIPIISTDSPHHSSTKKEDQIDQTEKIKDKNHDTSNTTKSTLWLDLLNPSFIFSPLFGAILFKISITFIYWSMSHNNIVNFYQDRFHVETYQLGYLTSFSTAISMLFNAFAIHPIAVHFHQKEASLITYCLGSFAILSFFEIYITNLYIYIILYLIPKLYIGSIIDAAMTTYLLNITPTQYVGRIHSGYNFLSSCLGVITPIYGTKVFLYFGGANSKGFVSLYHYCIASLIGFIWCHLEQQQQGQQQGQALNEENNNQKSIKSKSE
jgi:MFS family permease